MKSYQISIIMEEDEDYGQYYEIDADYLYESNHYVKSQSKNEDDKKKLFSNTNFTTLHNGQRCNATTYFITAFYVASALLIVACFAF
jgi:hypothetical protein